MKRNLDIRAFDGVRSMWKGLLGTHDADTDVMYPGPKWVP